MKETEDKAGHPYRLCPKCGATDTDIPEPGIPALSGKERNPATGGMDWTPNPVRRKRAKK